MRVRYTDKPDVTGFSSEFNPHGMGEVVVYYDGDGGASSEYISSLEVLIGKGWKLMADAFRDKDLITDNYNTRFFEPRNDVERERGFTL